MARPGDRRCRQAVLDRCGLEGRGLPVRGHAAGLTHGTATGLNNLMVPIRSGMNVTSGQRSTMMNVRSKINSGPNYLKRYEKEPYPYVHDSETGVVYTITSLLNWNTKYRKR